MMSLELGNDCNANCLFCRTEKGEIYDLNPNSPTGKIAKGRMPYDMCIDILEQIKDDALIAVLYTNGEPLMYKELPRVIKFASQNHLATMISTNGLLLDEKKAFDLLEAGIDFIKIQLSGFTQGVYSVQVRKDNDVEKLKENIRILVRLNREGRYGAVILVDYMLYNYNRHEFPLAQQFCKELGVMINVRPGNPAGGLEEKEPSLSSEEVPLKRSCDWLWKAMQVNWNGEIWPCCEGANWSGATVYDQYKVGQSRVADIWNGIKAKRMRQIMVKEGRKAVPICSQCLRKGITFKW